VTMVEVGEGAALTSIALLGLEPSIQWALGSSPRAAKHVQTSPLPRYADAVADLGRDGQSLVGFVHGLDHGQNAGREGR
jgi:hypothetical protein